MKVNIQNTQNINIHLQMRVFLFRRCNFNQIDLINFFVQLHLIKEAFKWFN